MQSSAYVQYMTLLTREQEENCSRGVYTGAHGRDHKACKLNRLFRLHGGQGPPSVAASRLVKRLADLGYITNGLNTS